MCDLTTNKGFVNRTLGLVDVIRIYANKKVEVHGQQVNLEIKKTTRNIYKKVTYYGVVKHIIKVIEVI